MIKARWLPLAIGACALVAATAPVRANTADYCEAYARDFADTGTADEASWQRRFENAEQQCLKQYAGLARKAEEPRRALAAKPAKPRKPAATVEKVAVAIPDGQPTKPQPAKSKQQIVPGLEPGSDAWNDYCARKYTSFDKATGTYLSRTGVKRKCLVTADFKY